MTFGGGEDNDEEARRVQELEAELGNIRQAFEEYIATTQDLEIDLDKELQDMQGKLDHSTVAYETLADKLKNMEPMLQNLELSLGGTKKRLKEEARLRRQAEVAKVEALARLEETEKSMAAMKEENEALRDEREAQLQDLASRIGSSVQSRRRDERSEVSHLINADSGVVTEMTSNKTKGDAFTAGDDSYSEVLDELETVTEQLISTQQKLWRTEDTLRESEAQVQELQAKLSSHGKNQIQMDKTDEMALRNELEMIRAELIVSKQDSEVVLEQARRCEHLQREIDQREIEIRDLVEQNKRIEMLSDHVVELEESSRRTHEQLSHYEELLEESQEENARLVEEIACLRDILHDSGERDSIGGTTESSEISLREKISKEVKTKVLGEANKVREKEINALREQFKKIFRENTVLNERIEKLERGTPSLSLGQEDYKLRKEVERLSEELQAAKAEHHNIIMETEASWRKKLEQIMTGEFIPEDLLEEMEDEMRAALDSAAERVRSLQQDKEILTDRIEELDREVQFMNTKILNSSQLLRELEANQIDSHDEILRLKKTNTHLTAELEYTTKIMSRMDAECERLTRQHSMIKAELEVALDVIETSGIDSSSTVHSETLGLKEKNYTLTTKLDKLKKDYSALLDELEMNREKFLDSQEETGRKSEAQMKFLSDRIIKLEESLEKSKLEKEDLSKRVLAAQSKQDNAINEGEIKRNKMLEADIEKLQNTISRLEQDLKEAKKDSKPILKELKQVKDALTSSRIENKKLEEEMSKIKEDGARTISIGANDAGTDKSRSRGDVDPLEETLVSGYPLIRSGSRDPPSARGSFNSDAQLSKDTSAAVGHLRLLLEEMTLENEFLKERILGMSKQNVNASLNEEIYRLKTQLGSKTLELKETEVKLKKVRYDLEEAEEKLREAENAIDQAEAANGQLKSEISALQDVVHGARQNETDIVRDLERTKKLCTELQKEIDAQATASLEEAKSLVGLERGNTLIELRRKLQDITDEKVSLQHQVDDSKIALSVCQYAQERGKEELRICHSRLNSSISDVNALKTELTKMTSAYTELKAENEILLAKFSGRQTHVDDQRTGTIENRSTQMDELAEENLAIQQLMGELEDALMKSQTEVEAKKREIESLDSKLLSSQEETRLLSEEISKMSVAFEKAQGEYDSVLDELDAVNEIFERARDESEQMGRLAAKEEIRSTMQSYKEKENKSTRMQLEKAFADNIALQKKLDEAETALIGTKQNSTSDNKINALEKEIEIIHSALLGSQNEVRILKEKCFDLEMALKQTTIDLEQARDELEFSQDEPVHPRLLSAVFETEEMQELKEQFNALIEENFNLEQVVRESEIALTLAKVVEERNKETLQKLGEEMSDFRTSKRKLQEEVYNLTVELETSKDDHETILQDTKAKIHADNEAKLKDLKYKVDQLLIENATLQTKLRKTNTSVSSAESHSEIAESDNLELQQLKDKLGHLQEEYKDSNEEKARLRAQVHQLEELIATMSASDAKSPDDAGADVLVSQLGLAQTENVNLKSKISLLDETLQQKSDMLRQLREEFDEACFEIEHGGIESTLLHSGSDVQTDQVYFLQNELKKLTDEKEALEKQVDEARVSRSMTIIPQDKNIVSEEFPVTGTGKEQDMTAIIATSCDVKDEHAATMEVLERINVLLASVEFLERHHEIHVRTSHPRLVSTSQKAEEVRRKVAFLTYALQKSKKEHSDVLMQLKSSKREAKELRSKVVKEIDTKDMPTTPGDEVTTRKERRELEERLEATTLALRTARESEQRHKIEADLSEEKYREIQRASTYLKDQVIILQDALQSARKDQPSTSPQLSTWKSRAGGLARVADGLGSSSDMNKSNSIDPSDTESDSETEETLNLYQRIYQENVQLKSRLEETEAALAAARDMKSHHEAELKKLQFDAGKADELQSINTELNSELDSLKSNLVRAKSNREVVRLELESVKQRLDDIRAQENRTDGATADGQAMVQKEAELRLLQSQFKKLTEQSENLSRQVRDAENAVSVVRDAQEQLKLDIEARATLAKDLQDQIEEAVDTTKKRNQELSELTVMMESRVCLTEESIEKLQQEISETKGSLQISKAGLFVTSSYERAKKFTRMVERSTTSIPPEPVRDVKEVGKSRSSVIPSGTSSETGREENRVEDSQEVETGKETSTHPTMMTSLVDNVDEIREGVSNSKNSGSRIFGMASSSAFRNHARRPRSHSPAFRINSHLAATQSNQVVGVGVAGANAIASNSSADERSSTDRNMIQPQQQQLGSSMDGTTDRFTTPERRKTPIARRSSRTSPFLRTVYDVDRLSSSLSSKSASTATQLPPPPPPPSSSSSSLLLSERDTSNNTTEGTERIVCVKDNENDDGLLGGMDGGNSINTVTTDGTMKDTMHPMSAIVKGWSTAAAAAATTTTAVKSLTADVEDYSYRHHHHHHQQQQQQQTMEAREGDYGDDERE